MCCLFECSTPLQCTSISGAEFANGALLMLASIESQLKFILQILVINLIIWFVQHVCLKLEAHQALISLLVVILPRDTKNWLFVSFLSLAIQFHV